MAMEPTSSSNVPAGRRDLRGRVAPDGQVRDFPRRAVRPPKQLVVDEQAEPCTGSQRQERRVAAATGAPERMLAQHREIHVVLDRNTRPKRPRKKAEDIEVLQPGDVVESVKRGLCEDRSLREFPP